ncbi:MAG: DUF3502 domain-containing protein [Solobacterium sp.]|nr:DUF3502 domain-containing protein [Solobacterium sp.]
MRVYRKTAELCLSVLLLITAGCAQSAGSGPEQQYPVFRIALPGIEQQPDSERAEEIINEILREELGAEIEIEAYKYEEYHAQMKKNLARENDYDILFANNEMFIENWLSGSYLDITDLIEENGQGIISAVGRDILDHMKIDGRLFAVTNIRDYAVTLDTVYLEQGLLDQYGIDPRSITSEADLEECFARIHAEDPDVLIASAVNYFGNEMPCAFLPPLGVLDESGSKYINYFETEEYLNHLRKLHGWYEKGWIRAQVSGDTVILDNDHPFALYRYGKPGGDIETSMTHDGNYTGVLSGADVLPAGVYFLSAFAVSSAADSPAMAMRILDLFYTDQRINQALSEFMYGWTLPNLFLSEVPEGYPSDLWQQQKSFNENAVQLPDTGFVFNPAPVMKEYLSASEIYQRYRSVLATGIADPQTAVKRMNEELEEAGLQRIIDEKNRQYKAWRNR